MHEQDYRRPSPAFPRRLVDKSCPNCGVIFRPRVAVQKYCSMSCYRGGPPPSADDFICEASGCDRVKTRRHYCGAHYAREKRHGDVQAHLPIRDMDNWGTGRTVNANGYSRVYAPGQPGTDAIGYILEHRLVMARMLGRPLLRSETVHHKNGNKLDNTPENLELWCSRHPRGQTIPDLVGFAVEILTSYAPERLR